MKPATSLPWRVGDAGHTVFGPPNGKTNPGMVAQYCKMQGPNAAYIVHACNAYPRLVEALRDVVENPSETMRDNAAIVLRSLGELE